MQVNIKHITDITKNIKPTASLVYLIIKEHNGIVTSRQIADELGLTRRNVNYLLQDLIAQGYITKLEKGFKINY